jgi:DNA (cytosine-5)-methyltransferase 1
VAKGKRRIAQIDGVKTFNFEYPEQNEVTVRLRDILESDVEDKYYLDEEKTTKLVAQIEDNKYRNKNAVYEPYHAASCYTPRSQEFVRTGFTKEVSTLAARDYKDPKCVVIGEGMPIREATKKGYALAEEGDAVNFQFPDSKTRRGRIGKQIANTLEASGINQGVVTPRYRIRKLTPRECFRLQGFPDSEFDKLTANGISNSQLYKMAGNAVTVNVIDAIGKRLVTYLND